MTLVRTRDFIACCEYGAYGSDLGPLFYFPSWSADTDIQPHTHTHTQMHEDKHREIWAPKHARAHTHTRNPQCRGADSVHTVANQPLQSQVSSSYIAVFTDPCPLASWPHYGSFLMAALGVNRQSWSACPYWVALIIYPVLVMDSLL